MENINEIDDKKQNIYFTYFIQSHHFTHKNKVYLSSNYPEANSLECINEQSLKKDSATYNILLYRFKSSSFTEENKEVLKIISEDNNNEKNEFEISIIYPEKNTFLFDFNSNLNIFESKLSLNEEFDIYITYLKEKFKINKDSVEYKDFLYSLINYLNKNDLSEKIDFSFYIILFLQCLNTEYFLKILELFNSEKIKDQIDLTQNKIDEFKNIITDFNNLPKIEKEEEIIKEQLTINLYSIIFYFCYKYEAKMLDTLLESTNSQKYILKGLLKHRQFFSKIILKKNEIIQLVQISDSFKNLSDALSFNRDFLTLLEIINENIELFNEKINDKENSLINIDKFIIPKKEDDMIKINSEIHKYLLNEKQYNKKFLKLSPNIFDKYLILFDSTNLENINLINISIKEIKEVNPSFEVKNDIDFVIHNNTISNAKQHKLSNMEILNYIQYNKFYNDDKYNSLKYRSIEIISGIDVSSINAEFIQKWKQIDFLKIFYNSYYAFLIEVCKLVKNISHFGILFELLNKNKGETIYKIFDNELINLLQEVFEQLLKTYEVEKCPNFIDDIADLIFFTDQYNNNVIFFLREKIQKNLSNNIISNIYLKVLSKYKFISDPVLDIIVSFFTQNYWNTNVSTLLELIKSSPEIKGKIMNKIDKYVIKEDEFFEVTETNNFKLLSGLLKSDNFFQNEGLGGNYIEKTMIVIQLAMQDVKNLNINYNLINYFVENKKEDVLYERLLTIFLYNEKEARKMKELFIKDVKIIKNSLNQLQSSLDKITLFFPNKYYKEIMELNEIIKNIKMSTIESYLNVYSFEYNNYISKFKEDIDKIGKRSESCFFITVYNDIKNKNKFDNDKCFNRAIKQFDKMKDIFSKNKLADSQENILDLCLKPFKNKKDELRKEIDIDIELLNLKKIKDKEKLYEDLLILLRRLDVINIIESIRDFISFTGAIKGEFSKELGIRLKKLQNKKVTKIAKAIALLSQYGINIEKNETDNNDYLDIIQLIKNQPDSIEFLLTTSIEDCRMLQELPGLFENGFLSMGDILDLEKCIDFAQKIMKFDEFHTLSDIDVINRFKEEVKKYNNIGIYFTKFINNFGLIKEMIKNGFDRAEMSKNKVLLLLEKSEMTITNIKDNFFKCIYYEKNKKNNNNSLLSFNLSLKDLFDLRDRAQLNRAIINKEDENNKEKETIALNNKKFIELVSEINNLYSLLQEIYWKGYSKEVIININIEKNNINYQYENKDYNNFEELITLIKDILEKIKEQEKLGYREKKLVRYFFGLQFNFFYQKATAKKKQFYELSKLMPFLIYVTNELIVKNLESYSYKKSQNPYQDIIINCEMFLNKILKLNKLSYEAIFKDTIIEQKTKIGRYKGIYTYFSENLEKDLFQIYKYFTFHNPVAQNILLCNKDSTIEEITAFLYRSILCEFNSCFIIGGIECLNFEQRKNFLDLIYKLYVENYRKMNSCLFILYTNKTSDIYKWLELERTVKKLDINKEDYEKEKYEGDKIQIIFSDKSGVGKSTKIKKEILDKNKKYIYFPFGGVLDRDEILNRLHKLELDNNCIIHLDLFDTDQPSLMMEFLFSALITKIYGKNESIFYFSKEIEIKIEIPNSFIDFFSKFPILNLFPKTMLSINDLAPLNVSEDLTSNVQIVCNYLKDLKENTLNQKDLIFPVITPEAIKTQVYFIGKQSYSTAEDARVLSQNECQELIFNIINANIKQPTYYQINSFIDVLAVQLKKFNQNFYLNARQLKIRDPKMLPIRSFIVESFIKITKHFTEGAFTGLLKMQEQTHKALHGKYNEDEDINNAVTILAQNINPEIISFDKIDPSLIFFHEGEGQSFSIITNKNKKDKEYIDLLALQNSQALKKSDLIKELPNYKKYTQKQFLTELKDVLDIKNPVEKEIGNPRKSLEEICGNYVFTADNFVKMILILLRIRANIPVIMMGETGCGKTSLIRKLSELKNDGNGDKMKILNIHAGTNDTDIINFINQKVIPESVELAIKELERKSQYEKMGLLFEEAKIWVFLDEINTCKSMGLISELLCKKTYQGNSIPSNVVFIAACNPYRQRDNTKKVNIGLNINQAHQQKKYLNEIELEDIQRVQNNNLVYTVNPLPHSLLNFVFDFGNLTPEDEENYIKCMIRESLEKKFNENRGNFKDSDLKKLINITKDMLVICHNFIRKYNEISSVSLREIRRFNIFYEFFYDYIKLKKKNEQKNTERSSNNNNFTISNIFSFLGMKELDIHISAINLSIFICYYMRITNKQLREMLYNQLNQKICMLNDWFNGKDFLEIPLNEEKFIADNIQIDIGIAKNKALLENLFSLFVAINNKVPIFIVGKPGCSKSLSVQLITRSMRGYLSKNPFFKELPKVIVNSYQGSMGSTSEGVENVFKKARKVIQEINPNERDSNISMIFFDEMGLAEHSPNNPLKVIHAELEYDLNEGDKKIAFVGISNWALDASKMNRGIFISIPEPDEEDMKETALTIGKSYNDILSEKFRYFFEHLGKTYFEYKKYLKEQHSLDGKEDFHGNRDFYHLVKNASKNLANKYYTSAIIDDYILCQIGIDSIERNFAGIEFDINKNEKISSLEIVKNIYKGIYPNCIVYKEYDVTKRIIENLLDLDSRYLLLIANSSISSCLLSTILKQTNKTYNFFIGSEFEEDQKSEEYSLKVLNKVQLHMEQGNILILNNLEPVYPNLYDLFNQNFTLVSNKNYARLAVGSTTNTFSYVNNHFRCIVNVDKDKIEKEEAPFLNRFEKHILSYEYILNKELLHEAYELYNVLQDLVKINSKEYKGINYDLSKLLINCNLEEIQGIFYEENQKNINKYQIIDDILKRVSLVLPEDILYSFTHTKFQQSYPNYAKKMTEFYHQGEHNNLANFIKKLNNRKNVVYTFSNNMEAIKNIKNINNPIYGNFENENITQIEISSIKSEIELERQLDIFYSEEKYKLCLIKIRPFEGKFMNYLNYFIDNKDKNYELNRKDNKNKSHKIFIFIVHMVRIFNSELKDFEKKSKTEQNEINKKILNQTLSSLTGYHQIFIDNINGKEELALDKILKMERDEIYLKCLDIDNEFLTYIFTSLTYMDYNIISSVYNLNQNTYIKKLMHYIRYNAKIRKLINDCIIRQIPKEEDILTKIFKKKNSITADDVDLVSVIINYLSEQYSHQLNLFVFKSEKDHFFSSLLSSYEEKKIEEENMKNKNNKKKFLFFNSNSKVEKKEEEDEDYVEDINNVKKDLPDLELDKDLNKKSIFEITKEVYLHTLKFNDNTRVTENPGANHLEVFLGLRLPGLKTTIDQIVRKVKEDVIIKYFKNEDDLRRNENKGDLLKNDINNYKEELKRLNDITYLEIENKEIFHLIEKEYSSAPEEIKKFYDLILNDYYTLYININFNVSKNDIINNNKQKNNNENQENNDKENEQKKIYNLNEIEETKRMLKLLVELKDKYCLKEDDYKKQIGSIINWLEVYSYEIISILKMYITLNKVVTNLYEQIKAIIDKNQVHFEKSERNPEYKSLVNETFFIALESLLRVITSNDKIYTNLKKESEKFFELINIDKQIHQDGLSLNANLSLFSKEIFSIQEIIIIFEALYKFQLNSFENLTQTIKFFSKQTNLIIKEKKSDLISNLKKLFEFLYKNIKNNNENYGETINSILWNEFIKIEYEEYRTKIIEIILEHEELIPHSTQILTFVVNNTLNHSIEGILNNLDIIHDSNSKIIKMLNSSKKIFVDEILINIFETKINIYFDLIKYSPDEELEKYYPKLYLDKINKKNNDSGIILEQSFYAFKKYLDYLELAALGKKKKHNSHIIKLYALTYVKIYLSKVVNFLMDEKNQLGDISEIIEVIKGKNNNKFRKVIKIYVFKLFFSYMKDYEEFLNFDFKKYHIDFYKEFDFDNKNEKKEQELLNYYMIPLDDNDTYQRYMHQFSDFELTRKNQFNLSKTKDYADFIKTNGIDFFLVMSINKIISNLGLNKLSSKQLSDYHKLSIFTQNLLNKECLFQNQNMKVLLSLFFDENIFNNQMKPKIMNYSYMNQKLLEIILYGFRFCVSSLSAREDPNNDNKILLYESLLSTECLTNLKKSYIPGCDTIEDLHIITLEDVINHLNTLNEKHGCYVCSCGYYYEVRPCGFPSRPNTSICPICGLNIGWAEIPGKGHIDHGLVQREGHYRIYLDNAQRISCENRYGDTSENIPNKTLDDYKREVIEPILKKSQFGLNIVSKDFFLKTNKKVRNLSELSFRLLNFITYSHLFFANCLNYIDDFLLGNNCLVKNMTCLEILEKDWDIMEETLKQKGILSIQIFMNQIFSKISNLIKNCVYCSKEEDRNLLEDNVEKVVQQSLLDFQLYSEKYEMENKNQLALDNYDMKTLICELTPPNDKIYKKKEFPLLKYFMLTKYKSKEDFIKKLGPANLYLTKYPLIGQYLIDKPGPKKMKYLPQFNEFTNLMADTYSFKISRDDAKKRSLENEEIFKDPIFIKKFDNFIDIWDEIKYEAIKYKCRPDMEVKDLSRKDKLNNYLNDNAEINGGMYIAAACQNFITWQNSFIQPIIDSVKHNGILHFYVNNLQKKIPLQSAKINQTLLIDDCFKKSEYKSFSELIYTFSNRDIFKGDGTINYINYNSFIYDYTKIEEELGKLLLPGKCLFDSEDNLNFVTYWSEGFRGGKSSTLSTFYEKYPQKDLNNNEKEIIMNYISNILSNNHHYDFRGFFGSLQMLTFFLANNDVKKDEKISLILKKAPSYLKISNDCLNFFTNEGTDLTLDKLMKIFFFVEYLCFNDLIESLQNEYRAEIPFKITQKIKQKLFEQRNPYDKITIGDLAAAVRRFISRYLVGKRQDIDIDEKRDLAFELTRNDLWEEKIVKLEKFDELISIQLNEFNLKVGQAYSFYQIIAGEDKIGIPNYEINSNNFNSNNSNINDPYNNIHLENNNINNYNNINFEDNITNNNKINYEDNIPNNYNNINFKENNPNNYNNNNYEDNIPNNYNNINFEERNPNNYNNINYEDNIPNNYNNINFEENNPNNYNNINYEDNIPNNYYNINFDPNNNNINIEDNKNNNIIIEKYNKPGDKEENDDYPEI